VKACRVARACCACVCLLEEGGNASPAITVRHSAQGRAGGKSRLTRTVRSAPAGPAAHVPPLCVAIRCLLRHASAGLAGLPRAALPFFSLCQASDSALTAPLPALPPPSPCAGA
jgi:hypothetical protein